MKTCLTIAGSDCSGGAGIQADIKTICAHGVYATSAIVSVVAENTQGVLDMQHIAPAIVARQLDAIFLDIGADAVKLGMLPSAACMEEVAKKLRQYAATSVVMDPVMCAKDGCALMPPDALCTFLTQLLPLANLVTPNIPEAELLTGLTIDNHADMRRAARRLCELGAAAALVKGGHATGDAVDILYDGTEFHAYSVPRIHTKNTHGTGCTYSSAIAANLALGHPLPQAVKRAKNYVTTAIRHGLEIGRGNGPTHHFYELYKHGLKEV